MPLNYTPRHLTPEHQRAASKKAAAALRAKEPKNPLELWKWCEDRASRGPTYKQVVERGWREGLANGDLTQVWVAEQIGVTQPTMSGVFYACRADLLKEEAEKELMLRRQGLGRFDEMRYIPVYEMDDAGLEAVADYFAKWRAEHFLTPQRTPYVTTHFHRRWIVRILRTIRDAGNLLILSPPRHGKTELLIHFNIFFIARVNPNISIVRVCKSEGLAKKALASMMDHLEHNKGLREATLDIGEEFVPEFRGGKPWNSLEFTVATRNIVGLKSPTCTAVGAGGTLLSRDGDIFVVDDIEDQQTVYTQEMRMKRLNWFMTDLMSRKVDGTAIIYIGSRQHPDDVPGHLIDNPEWDVVIESAHDEGGCTVEDPDKRENWDKHVECVLWPEVRNYAWLMSIKYDPQRAATFPMIYLNEPTDEETDVFSRAVVDLALDKDRIYVDPVHNNPLLNVPGEFHDDLGIHHPIRLIAGLDPSGTGYQASFLWAVDLAAFTLYAVDFENRLGGGIGKAREVVQRWFAQYGVKYWVIESNLYHGAFLKDEMLQAIARRDSITLRPHETGSNKWDPTMGVSAIASMMREGQVSIPWGNVDSQAKWQMYRSQLINFSRDGRKGRKRLAGSNTDIVMASWFPLETMQRWRREWLTAREDLYVESGPFVDMSDLYAATFGL